jgi:purine-cytosine permease-like protein
MKGFFSGQRPLWQAFWGIFIGGYALVFIINVIITASLDEIVTLKVIAAVISFIMFVYLIASLVAVWSCSKNVGWRGWGWIARSVIFLAIVNSIYSTFITWNKLIPDIERLIKRLENLRT